jgi:hypothetical protein
MGVNAAYHAEDRAAPGGPALAAGLAALPADARGLVAFTFHPSVRYLASLYRWTSSGGPIRTGRGKAPWWTSTRARHISR